jgi:putative transposase
VQIERANQVWTTDITYLPMAKGFAYLIAIIDLYSRRVMSWRLSNTMDTSFCIEALEEAIRGSAHRKYLIPIKAVSLHRTRLQAF